ncbi:P-loop containing nucleoside triphosphate hydrolase protein [Panaeolus papilionaceus]|nr:P-loop containing nucleoside triphosphate hydrolase protein [Panaeolus papilionaceus]
MASAVLQSFERLKVIGPISVERVERTTTPSWRIMVMGSTGTGKSTFIESFADDKTKTVQISGATLEGVTQDVVSYKLVNVVDKLDPNRLVYLVDTPGFADTKISEKQIVKMAQDWLLSENLLGVNRILYFAAVTDIRMAGSKKRTLEFFKAIAGEKAAEVVVFVTTMWDNICTSRMADFADDRFKELQAKHWNVYIKKGAKVVKFENNQKSSLAILDQICNIRVSGLKWFEFEEMLRQRKDIKNTIFGKLMFFSLLDRRNNLYMQLACIEGDIQDESVTFLWRTKLRVQKISLELTLKGMEKELKDFGQISQEWEKEWNHYVNGLTTDDTQKK